MYTITCRFPCITLVSAHFWPPLEKGPLTEDTVNWGAYGRWAKATVPLGKLHREHHVIETQTVEPQMMCWWWMLHKQWLTWWIGIKKQHGRPQNWCKHSVVQRPGGIYAHNVEAHSPCNARNNRKGCYSCIHQNLVGCGEITDSTLGRINLVRTLSPTW